MKGDFSRDTFDAKRRYSGVRMQQGRVQLDADWNEQVDITRYRVETGTDDLIGDCGGPLHDAAFRIVLDPTDLDAEALAQFQAAFPGYVMPAGDFILTGGRFYVDGILCENDYPVPFLDQPDFPGATLDPDAPDTPPSGLYVVYLDVWQRHLTALDVRSLRETALGGPDTATRTRTIWQVRSVFAGTDPVDCHTEVDAYDEATAPSSGRLRARAAVEATAPDPCIISPSAGYRGLENQLYRVEVHEGGDAYDLTAAPSVFDVTSADPNVRTVTVATGAWNTMVGHPIEIFFDGPGEDPNQGLLAYIVSTSGRTLTLNTDFPAIDLARQPKVRRVSATAKWSRDNGIVASRIESIDGDEITVHDMGVDSVLGFAAGQWAEIIDDARVLNGEPGVLLRIVDVDPGKRKVTLSAAPTPWPGDLAAGDPSAPAGLLLRRWDGALAVKANAPVGAGWLEIEAGVQVAFDSGTYHADDYWTIPARTATSEEQSGNVEWPQDDGGIPLFQPPRGIRHHYCRLGVLSWDGTAFDAGAVEDCRCLFAPLTEVNSLSYVSGAGQEAMPDLTDPTVMPLLGEPLVVGVANGQCHEGAMVRFTVVTGDGDLAPDAGSFPGAATVDVPVDYDGLARCWWRLGGVEEDQLVQARLLEEGIPVQLPVIFNANLSVAGEVAYDPRSCATLAGQKDVQAALDRVVDLVRIYPAGGEGQEAVPGGTLEPLHVLVTSTCGPVVNTENAVQFEVVTGTGTLDGGGSTVTVPTDGDGVATVSWTLDATTPYQEVEARLLAAAGPAAEPTRVVFGATLSTADRVSFEPGVCAKSRGAAWTGVKTVQQAIDVLCETQGSGACECDRRPYVPLLTQTLPDLTYRDGRNYFFTHDVVPFGLPSPAVVFDGVAVWVSGKSGLMRILKDATPAQQPKVIATEVPGMCGTYDGQRVWFTSPEANSVVFADTGGQKGGVLPVKGEFPLGIAFDGTFVWVANFRTNNLNVIDPVKRAVVNVIGLKGSPTGLAFDGLFMWAGVFSPDGLHQLIRIPAAPGGDTGGQEPEVIFQQDGPAPWHLAFDGSHVWATSKLNGDPLTTPQKTNQQWGPILKVDVVARTVSQMQDFPNSHALVFDGDHMWVVDQQAPPPIIYKVDVDTNQSRGNVVEQPARVLCTGAYDGAHLWYSVMTADGAGGVQRRLIG